MSISLIGEYLNFFSGILSIAYNKHFVYYSVIERSVRFVVSIKGIASKFTLSFL